MIYFNSNEKKLIKKAESLIPAIDTMSHTWYPGFKVLYPILNRKTEVHWKIYFKIASLTIANLSLTVSKHEKKTKLRVIKKIRKLVDKDLDEKGSILLKDCQNFFYSNMENVPIENNETLPLQFADTIGLWMMRSLFPRNGVSLRENEMIREFGLLATKGFLTWWED